MSRMEERIEQLQMELCEFVKNIPRRERTIGDANMATHHQMKELQGIIDDFKEAVLEHDEIERKKRSRCGYKEHKHPISTIGGNGLTIWQCCKPVLVDNGKEDHPEKCIGCETCIPEWEGWEKARKEDLE